MYSLENIKEVVGLNQRLDFGDGDEPMAEVHGVLAESSIHFSSICCDIVAEREPDIWDLMDWELDFHAPVSDGVKAWDSNWRTYIIIERHDQYVIVPAYLCTWGVVSWTCSGPCASVIDCPMCTWQQCIRLQKCVASHLLCRACKSICGTSSCLRGQLYEWQWPKGCYCSTGNCSACFAMVWQLVCLHVHWAIEYNFCGVPVNVQGQNDSTILFEATPQLCCHSPHA